MKKKMLSIMLAGLLAFGAAACGGDDDAGDATGTSTEAPAATEATS